MATTADLKRDFQRLIKNDALGHGYLFFGRHSNDSFLSFAQSAANYLENGKWDMPDVALIDSMVAGAGIDDIRRAIHFLWQKPFRSKRKTLIIPNAGELTAEAQNAILKIAEEPPAHALIIILVRDPDILLSTLSSRFQKIYVHGNFQFPTPTGRQAISHAYRQAGFFQLSKAFLTASGVKRKEIIKELIDGKDNAELENFVAGLITGLRSDIMKNWKVIKEILHRWSLIKKYNVNKKLQLEAVLLSNDDYNNNNDKRFAL